MLLDTKMRATTATVTAAAAIANLTQARLLAEARPSSEAAPTFLGASCVEPVASTG